MQSVTMQQEATGTEQSSWGSQEHPLVVVHLPQGFSVCLLEVWRFPHLVLERLAPLWAPRPQLNIIQ